MTGADKYSQRMADYIYGDMDASERLVFEKELKTDEKLARDYHNQLKIARRIKEKIEIEETIDESELAEADRLVNKHREQFPEDFIVTDEDRANHQAFMSISGRTGSLRRIIYPLAAAAAAVIVGILIISNVQSADQGSRLYIKYYDPLEDARFVKRSAGGQEYKKLHQALYLYWEGEYSTADKLLTELTSSHSEIDEAILFLGLSKMGEGNISDAVIIFNNYLSDSDKYRYEASWYLSLCYIKTGQSEKARDLLLDLTSINGDLGKDATKLLKRLDKLN